MSNTYRTNTYVTTIDRRWGATFFVRLATWSVRRKRAQAREDLARRREEVEECWEQMEASSHMLYKIECECGHHVLTRIPSTIKGEWGESWKYVDPRKAIRS